MKRLLSLLLSVACTSLVLTTAASASPAPVEPSGGVLDYNDYLLGHLSYPAVEQAERFVAKQEGTSRPAASDATYGKEGCEPETTYEVGDQRSFWVSQQQLGNLEEDFTLAAKSEHGYVWVQDEFYIPIPVELPQGFVSQAEAEAAAEDWDAIYDTDRAYFGREPNPKYDAVNLAPGLPADWRDADCDPRVHILNFPIDAPVVNGALGYVAGYFSSEHEYPNGTGEHESPFSNEGEMFFMNSMFLNPGNDTYAGVLAHEFFHMIQFSNDYNEETWVNEGMADIAAVVNGFGDIVDGHISAYEDEPDQHLMDWTGVVDDYGQAFLFFDYLFNHYGAPEDESTEKLEAYGLAKLLTRTKADGAKGVTKVINTRKKGLKKKVHKYYRKGNFGKVYKDYIVANYLDMPEANAGQYGYANRDVSVAQTGTEDSSPEDSTVFPYGADYYEVTGDGTMDATAEDPVAIIPATEGQPEPAGGYFAWSNRADEMITFLERSANLSATTAPSLQFKYWHQIEADWDYAYVRISTDQGNTWEFQNTSACGGVATDPNGNNRAVTESGGITGDSDGWQECALDLTPYAGQKVVIRYEYDTDQAVTEPGYVVDDVALVDGDTKIWKKTTNFETAKRAKAWTFGGDGLIKWLRIQPLAKNQPLIIVLRVSGNNVKRQVLTRKAFAKVAEGLALEQKGSVGDEKTVIVVSGTTPIATTPFGYSYNIVR
ncbi:MAG: hypothetical protein GEU71_11035 [Actinobacteria bacterium]|nr:hypothetical protein [Actinomycetota bacterium]